MLVHKIKNDWSKYVVDVCSGKSNCAICATKNVPNVALDCDLLKLDDALSAINVKHGKSSDCLLIEQDGVTRVAVVEFKSKWTDGTGAAKQVIAGCRIAKHLLSLYNIRDYKIYLIVSACSNTEAVKKMFFQEIKKSGEVIERAIVAGCHDEFENLRNRRRDY